jgi:hypothetical protein
MVRYDVLYHIIAPHGNPPPAKKVVLALADGLLDVHVVKVGVGVGQPQAHRPAVNAAGEGVAHLLHPAHLQRRRVPREDHLQLVPLPGLDRLGLGHQIGVRPRHPLADHPLVGAVQHPGILVVVRVHVVEVQEAVVRMPAPALGLHPGPQRLYSTMIYARVHERGAGIQDTHPPQQVGAETSLVPNKGSDAQASRK